MSMSMRNVPSVSLHPVLVGGGHTTMVLERSRSRPSLKRASNSQWKPDTTVSSEVEVKFIPDGANATRVELEHRKFERMGAEPGEVMRQSVDGGWPGMLERFKSEAEAA